MKVTILRLGVHEDELRKKAEKYGWELYYNKKTGEWAVVAENYLWAELNNILTISTQVSRGPEFFSYLPLENYMDAHGFEYVPI